MSSDEKNSSGILAEDVDLTKNEFKRHENLIVENSYPFGKVIAKYTFFGGAIGGGLLMPFVFLQIEGFNLASILASLVIGFILGATFGSLVGLIPATLAGFLIASFKLYRNFKGLLLSAIIGACATAIVTSSIGYDIFASISIVLVGATSAVLTGLFALPKLEKEI